MEREAAKAARHIYHYATWRGLKWFTCHQYAVNAHVDACYRKGIETYLEKYNIEAPKPGDPEERRRFREIRRRVTLLLREWKYITVSRWDTLDDETQQNLLAPIWNANERESSIGINMDLSDLVPLFKVCRIPRHFISSIFCFAEICLFGKRIPSLPQDNLLSIQ